MLFLKTTFFLFQPVGWLNIVVKKHKSKLRMDVENPLLGWFLFS